MSEDVIHTHHRERFYRRERRSVPAAREFAREALTEWGYGSREDEVLLCVSELATNALLHGVPPGRGFLLLLRRDLGGALRVEVHDSGGGRPHMAEGPERGRDQAECGRGLVLVDALADKWDVADRDPGKIVWCEFAAR
ncbi:Anti-sigma regulatory factor (Ser/Thr protein kinase) [Actinacidiphila alni]|uniref:Anti-sigma regulatory factor (Ser/Thr protein kinase) n=1 Tax=Actinacidiphila alni TaxID=380248 RepID=A0A1I2D117_9ACTN|nr:ATP-binding protein [Actinacidiphila alni]SFE74185.1 Anti-sigma regulatory factor (Ser/Thr protein kinase) [Actinacidiphila alni]